MEILAEMGAMVEMGQGDLEGVSVLEAVRALKGCPDSMGRLAMKAVLALTPSTVPVHATVARAYSSSFSGSLVVLAGFLTY